MSIDLVPLATATITLADPLFVGDGPAGTRVIIEVDTAEFTGDRLRGAMAGRASADWLVINGTVGTLDVRATLTTHDGALVFVQYGGRTDVTNGPGGAPLYIAPTFETSDERYTWLNSIQAVGKGQLDGSTLTDEMFELV